MTQGVKNKIVEIARSNEINPFIKQIESYSYGLLLHHLSVAAISGSIWERLVATGEMELSMEYMDNVIRGALIHDIGKTCICPSILYKKEALLQDEFELIKNHAVYGFDLIKSSFSEIEQNIVLLHHEKMDGTGYPRGTQDIPFYVKVVTVADMYDALISTRIYKKPFSHAETMDLLRKDAVDGKIELSIVNMLGRLK